MTILEKSPGTYKSMRFPSLFTGIWTIADRDSYWAQRYKLFSRYDEGVWLTDDAWFGVTPEPVAKYVPPTILPFIAEPLRS